MTDNYNDDWRDELEKDNPKVFERFCAAKNTPADIKVIYKLMYKYNNTKSKEEVLDRVLTWITDWNNQINIYPSDEEYKKLLSIIK